ncbi:MAG TPA: class I lanthipeptide [Thermoanaerobaculia bacterium]|nr:class I lanthipeptide [Thermoanaerobaculia bacterium]
MKKKAVMKLSLRRETILLLDREALAGVAGGHFFTSSDCIFASGCECVYTTISQPCAETQDTGDRA